MAREGSESLFVHHIYRFDSPTRSLHVSAGQDIFIKSGAGSIDASCLNDVRLHSEAGNVS